MEEKSQIKRIPKDEYARRIGVSMPVLRAMLNVEFVFDLRKVGYKKAQKHLTIKQIEVLENKCVNLRPEIINDEKI
jgi:hypothetical protein